MIDWKHITLKQKLHQGERTNFLYLFGDELTIFIVFLSSLSHLDTSSLGFMVIFFSFCYFWATLLLGLPGFCVIIRPEWEGEVVIFLEVTHFSFGITFVKGECSTIFCYFVFLIVNAFLRLLKISDNVTISVLLSSI